MIQPTLEANLRTLLHEFTAGDPMREGVLWTNLSLRELSRRLLVLGTPASPPKPAGRPAGRPKGRRYRPAPRYPAVKLGEADGSRRLLTANCMSWATIGARMRRKMPRMARMAPGPPRLSSLSQVSQLRFC